MDIRRKEKNETVNSKVIFLNKNKSNHFSCNKKDLRKRMYGSQTS